MLFLVQFRWSRNPRYLHVPFQCNFDGRNIHGVSTYFFQRNLDGEKSTLFAPVFFDEILMGKNSTSLSVSCKLMITLKEVFLC